MTIICKTLIGDEENFASILEKLKGYNLPCQVLDGVLEVRFTGPRTKAFEIVALFESLAEYEIVVVSQRSWKDEK